MNARIFASVAVSLLLLLGLFHEASSFYALECSVSGTIHLDPGVTGDPEQQESGFTVQGVLGDDCPEEAGHTVCAKGTLVGNCGGNQNESSYVTCTGDCDPDAPACLEGSPVTSGSNEGFCLGAGCVSFDDETGLDEGAIVMTTTQSVDPEAMETCLNGGTLTDTSFVGQITVVEK